MAARQHADICFFKQGSLLAVSIPCLCYGAKSSDVAKHTALHVDCGGEHKTALPGSLGTAVLLTVSAVPCSSSICGRREYLPALLLGKVSFSRKMLD